MFKRDQNKSIKIDSWKHIVSNGRIQKRKVYGRFLQQDCTIKLCFVIVILLCQISTSFANTCDPKDASTCKYMGKCVNIRLLKQYNPRQFSSEEDLHFCTCPPMSCYELPMEVMCADSGTSQETFYNDMCRRLAQCEFQRPFKKVCRGVCGDKNCRPFEKESNLKNCPEENEDYCHNRGLCLMFREGPQDPFCRCQRGFTGPRCKQRDIMKLVVGDQVL